MNKWILIVIMSVVSKAATAEILLRGAVLELFASAVAHSDSGTIEDKDAANINQSPSTNFEVFSVDASASGMMQRIAPFCDCTIFSSNNSDSFASGDTALFPAQGLFIAVASYRASASPPSFFDAADGGGPPPFAISSATFRMSVELTTSYHYSLSVEMSPAWSNSIAFGNELNSFPDQQPVSISSKTGILQGGGIVDLEISAEVCANSCANLDSGNFIATLHLTPVPGPSPLVLLTFALPCLGVRVKRAAPPKKTIMVRRQPT